MDTRSNPKAIENARKQKGFSLQQLADAIGLSLEHARDIERHDDELANTLTLSQLMALLACLNLSLETVFPNATFTSVPPKGFEYLREQVGSFCQKHAISLLEFENKVDFEIGRFIKSPSSALTDWDLDCLNNVCQHIGEPTEPYLLDAFEIVFRTISPNSAKPTITGDKKDRMTRTLCLLVILFAVYGVIVSVIKIPYDPVSWHHYVLIFLLYGSTACSLLLLPKINSPGRIFCVFYICVTGYLGTIQLLRLLWHLKPHPPSPPFSTRGTIKALDTAIDSYMLDHSARLPEKLDDLLPYLRHEKAIPKDGYGHDFIYSPNVSNGTYSIRSVGKDGIQGTKDDITN